MTKHHHKSKAEQIKGKAKNEAQAFPKKVAFKKNGKGSSANKAVKQTIDDCVIQLRAYQIYIEKGGSALDNWLEAERILNEFDMSQCLTVKDDGPDTYKKIDSRMSKNYVYR